MSKYVRNKVSQNQSLKGNTLKSVVAMFILFKCMSCATVETPTIESPELMTTEKQKEDEANRMREHYRALRERFAERSGKHGE